MQVSVSRRNFNSCSQLSSFIDGSVIGALEVVGNAAERPDPFRGPLPRRLEDDGASFAMDEHSVAVESKLLRQPDRLASTGFENASDYSFRRGLPHGRYQWQISKAEPSNGEERPGSGIARRHCGRIDSTPPRVGSPKPCAQRGGSHAPARPARDLRDVSVPLRPTLSFRSHRVPGESRTAAQSNPCSWPP
jgi:hypothetical protein